MATPGSVYSTFIEFQLLIIPQHHIHIPRRPLLFRRYKPTKNELKGPLAIEAVLALRPSEKSLSTELWILLASWHVTLKKFVASTMKTCLLTMCALALAPVCSGVLMVCVGLPPSLQ